MASLRQFLLVATLAAIAFSFAPVLEACSCPRPTPVPGQPTACYYFNRASEVFVGEVLSVAPAADNPSMIDAQLSVGEIFKGAMVSPARIRTGNTTAMCGLPFRVGEQWLIYARSGFTGSCDGTRLTASASADLTALRARSCSVTPAPTPTPTPTPTATPSPTPTPVFRGYYKLIARHSSKAIVVQSASTANGAAVIQWSHTSTTPRNDEWHLVSLGSENYRIVNRHSAKAMVVKGASTSEGAPVIQWGYTSSTPRNDEWSIARVTTPGVYRLVNRHSGKVAEVVGGSTVNGAVVAQRTWSGASHQQFQLVSVP